LLKNPKSLGINEWQGMQTQPNTKLRDLLKNKKAKIWKLSELFKTEIKLHNLFSGLKTYALQGIKFGLLLRENDAR
tara:strand:+ start:163 stop:390 length:228 start_codon:yes stop_codon:yes gene_type:complete